MFTSPAVNEGQFYLYYDPLQLLSPEAQARWTDPKEQYRIITNAIERAKGKIRP